MNRENSTAGLLRFFLDRLMVERSEYAVLSLVWDGLLGDLLHEASKPSHMYVRCNQVGGNVGILPSATDKIRYLAG